MESKTILAIDCGTQSLRAILFSDTGESLSKATIEYEPFVTPKQGWAEQDAQLFWDSLVKACRYLEQSNKEWFDAVAGIGVTSQRATMINVDAAGQPLRPAICWSDQRQAKKESLDNPLFNIGLSLLGQKKKIMDIRSRGKSTWIKQNQPEIWEKTHKFLQVSGYLNYKLTGKFLDSTASQVGYLPFDYKKQAWASKNHIASIVFPIEQEKLPDLVSPGKLLGHISPAASASTGIKPGIPVISCGADKGCESLGAGMIEPGSACLSLGTNATVQTVSEKYIEIIPHLPSFSAMKTGLYNPEAGIYKGFWMIRWFKKEFAIKEAEQAIKKGVPVELILNKSLEKIPPGSDGLVVQPYWGGSLIHPDGKGAMVGFTGVHTKDHIYRAIIEGLGFALLEGLEKIESKTQMTTQTALVCGGASQSDEICQIMADIFNRPVVRGKTHETGSLGAAILVAKGVGWYSTIDGAVQQMVHKKDRFEPKQEHAVVYKQLYRTVYKKIYPAFGKT